MDNELTVFKNSRTSRVVLLLSTLVAIFWVVVNLVDVYQWAAGGAIYELLAFSALGMLIALPVISLVHLFKERFNPRSLYLFSLLIILATVLFMFFGI